MGLGVVWGAWGVHGGHLKGMPCAGCTRGKIRCFPVYIPAPHTRNAAQRRNNAAGCATCRCIGPLHMPLIAIGHVANSVSDE